MAKHPTQEHEHKRAPQLDFYSRLGIAALLLEKSPYHSQWPLYDADIELVRPLYLNQCKFYFDPQQNPVAFVTWSNITEDTKTKLVDHGGQMEWDDWDNGPLLLFNDFVAPFGHTREILKDLRSQEWPHKIAFSLRRANDGSVKKVNYWWHKKDYKQQDLAQRRQGLEISV
jgi:cytolysin-activating lysine-acyltransferase